MRLLEPESIFMSCAMMTWKLWSSSTGTMVNTIHTKGLENLSFRVTLGHMHPPSCPLSLPLHTLLFCTRPQVLKWKQRRGPSPYSPIKRATGGDPEVAVELVRDGWTGLEVITQSQAGLQRTRQPASSAGLPASERASHHA